MIPCKHLSVGGCRKIVIDHRMFSCTAPEACANYEASGGSLAMHPSASGLADCGVCGYAVEVGTMALRIHDLEAELAAVKAERDARYTEQEMDEACALGLSWQRGDPRRKSGFAHEFFAMQDRVKESRKLKTALDAERGKR